MKRTFSDLTKDFVENIDVSEKTRKAYLSALRTFSNWIVFTGRKIKTLKKADILAYKSHLLTKNYSEKTIDLYLTSLRSFYDYLEGLNEHENIAYGIRLRNKKKGFVKSHLSVPEMESLMNSIKGESVYDLRDFALINIMIRTGIRCIEASRLRICDIEEDSGRYYICIQRKGRNSRNEKIEATKKTIQPIYNYLSYRSPSDSREYVFVSHSNRSKNIALSSWGIGHIVTVRMKAAGIYSKRKTAHSLRHSAAVHSLIKGASIKEVQTMLGHSSLKTTEIYLESVNEEMRLSNGAIRAMDEVF